MDVILAMVAGALVATIISITVFKGDTGCSLPKARAKSTECLADGGTFEHCVNKYLLGDEQ